MLTKWFLLTRLETRTKESNMDASIWVTETHMRNESDFYLVVGRPALVSPETAAGPHYRPIDTCVGFE